MARGRERKSSKKSGRSEIFQGMGAGWENKTKSGELLISLRLDIEDFLDWLDAVKLDKLPDEETKLSVILMEQTKSKKRGAPDYVVYGLDPILPEGEEEEEKPRRRRSQREEEPEEDEKPKRRRKKPVEEEEEEDPKPKRRKKRPVKEEEPEELDLDFDKD